MENRDQDRNLEHTETIETKDCQNLTNELEAYGIHIVALQKIRWVNNNENERLKVVQYIINFLRVNTKLLNVVLVCKDAPTETGEENIKDTVYEDLTQMYGKLPGNVIKLILSNLNAKAGRKTFILMIER